MSAGTMGNMTPTKKPDVEKRNAEREAALTFVRMAKGKGLDLTGPDGLLKQFTKSVLETALDEEMTEHLLAPRTTNQHGTQRRESATCLADRGSHSPLCLPRWFLGAQVPQSPNARHWPPYRGLRPRCGWRPCCMLHCISVRHESIGFEPQIDGENDAGDYGGGAHDVCGNLAGDGRGDVPADEAADAQHDGGRPIDRALDDEYH